MRGDGYNRLTNGQRDALVNLPIRTTDEDRRRALACADPDLFNAQAAINAVGRGGLLPGNFGEILAVARYEDAGWMPDGCFTRWCRWGLREVERKSVDELVQWLGDVENQKQGATT